MQIKIITELKKYSSKEKAKILPRFFKTGKGQYGEGDKFLGITVPNCRKVAKEFYKSLNLNDVKKLLENEFHEIRLTALMVLVFKFEKAKSDEEKKEVFDFYLKNTKYINNWDLVDLSCYKIVGAFLFDKDRSILNKLAKSINLWEQRIAIVSTMYFVKKKDLDTLYEISEVLLDHKHDLMHKAVGWLLREAGKVDQGRLGKFLKKNYSRLPRTLLRYAIERFEQNKRLAFLNGDFGN